MVCNNMKRCYIVWFDNLAETIHKSLLSMMWWRDVGYYFCHPKFHIPVCYFLLIPQQFANSYLLMKDTLYILPIYNPIKVVKRLSNKLVPVLMLYQQLTFPPSLASRWKLRKHCLLINSHHACRCGYTALSFNCVMLPLTLHQQQLQSAGLTYLGGMW